MKLQSIKALSILQPWASLIVHGHKKIETRSFQRSYRGPLLIHASKGKIAELEALCNCPPFKDCLPQKDVLFPGGGKKKYADIAALPFGAIIGMVQLVDIVPFDNQFGGALPGKFFFSETAYRNGLKATWDLTEKEYAFGDYSEGRYGWLLSDPIVFPEPIPCKGNLGLWNPTPEVMAQVEEQIKAAEHGK